MSDKVMWGILLTLVCLIGFELALFWSAFRAGELALWAVDVLGKLLLHE